MKTSSNKNLTLKQRFDVCLKLTQQRVVFNEDDTSEFLKLLIQLCKDDKLTDSQISNQLRLRNLVSSTLIKESLNANSDYQSAFDLDKIRKVAKSAKSTKSAIIEKQEIGKDSAKIENIANFAASQNNEKYKSTEDPLKITPLISTTVYENLPDFLKNSLIPFKESRKKDVFLTSALVIISGCIPEVTGVYKQDRFYPNLFSFIIAPAASGKAVLKNAKSLGDKIHENEIRKSINASNEYEKLSKTYDSWEDSGEFENNKPEKPTKPKNRILFIPADCSQSKLIELLKNNGGNGIICETEADVMSGANKQDWGGYSHMLRQAYHHEKLSIARKGLDLLIEIDNPRISVALAGTPSQVPKLIASAEDGLFSRFIFYAFKTDANWEDPSPQEDSIEYGPYFKTLSESLCDEVCFLEANPTNVELTKIQWSKFNQFFSKKLSDVIIFHHEDAASVVYRLGLIAFRLCMIFAAFRKMETKKPDLNIESLDKDFENALLLSDVYLKHSLLVYGNLPNESQSNNYKLPDNKRKFFESLPETVFKRKYAVDLGNKFDMTPRTVDNFLKNSVPSILKLIRTGYYQKK